MKKLLKISLFATIVSTPFVMASVSYAAVEIPARLRGNNLKIEVSVQSKFYKEGRIVSYNYTFNNHYSSKQPLDGVAIRFDGNIVSSRQPMGWSGRKFTNKPFWSWGAVEDYTLLQPGSTINDFVLQSEGLPGIQPYYAQGEIPLPKIDEIPEDISEQEFGVAIDIFHNSIIGTTVAPTSTKIHASPLEIIEFLMIQTHNARKIDWIQNNGIEYSLIQKLQAARDSFVRGQHQTTKNQLMAFQNQIRAQSEKQISGNAATILETGSEIVIQKL